MSLYNVRGGKLLFRLSLSCNKLLGRAGLRVLSTPTVELFHKNSRRTQHIDYFCKKGSTADELQTRLQLLFHENCYLVVGLKQVVLRVWPNGNVAATDDVNILMSKIDCSLPGVGCIYHYHHASMILLWLHRV